MHDQTRCAGCRCSCLPPELVRAGENFGRVRGNLVRRLKTLRTQVVAPLLTYLLSPLGGGLSWATGELQGISRLPPESWSLRIAFLDLSWGPLFPSRTPHIYLSSLPAPAIGYRIPRVSIYLSSLPASDIGYRIPRVSIYLSSPPAPDIGYRIPRVSIYLSSPPAPDIGYRIQRVRIYLSSLPASDIGYRILHVSIYLSSLPASDIGYRIPRVSIYLSSPPAPDIGYRIWENPASVSI